jgi:membrane protease YdiL (CAAX protease family)
MTQQRSLSVLAIFFALTLAWTGTALLLSPTAVRLFDNPSNLPMAFLGQALLWAIAAAVVAIVLFWERKPLTSLWLQPFHWQSIAWGLALVAIYYAVVFPISEWVRRAAGLPGYALGMERVMRFPISYRIVAFMSAGVVEELLFRGYTITRLTILTRNVWLAGGVLAVRLRRFACAVLGLGLCPHQPHRQYGGDDVLHLEERPAGDDGVSCLHRCRRPCDRADVLGLVEGAAGVMRAGASRSAD